LYTGIGIPATIVLIVIGTALTIVGIALMFPDEIMKYVFGADVPISEVLTDLELLRLFHGMPPSAFRKRALLELIIAREAVVKPNEDHENYEYHRFVRFIYPEMIYSILDGTYDDSWWPF
jgi:hypothetical protein